MDIKKIKELKDKIYEIEGLLELAQLREDKIEELTPLIQTRINDLMVFVYGTTISENPEVETIIEETVVEEEVEEVSSENEISDYRADDADEEVIDEEVIEEDGQEEVVPQEEETEEETEEEASEEEVSEEEVSEEEASEEEASEEEVIEEEIIEEEIEDPQGEETPVASRPVAVRKRPVFCLNDRFRFCRELFGNSETEFIATLDLISGMSDYDEAEEYFIDEMGWDPDNQDVSDFMEILRIYFGS